MIYVKKIVTLGEMMIRLMPPDNQRFEQASSFDIFYGGDESIVAATLSRFGLNVEYITRLPENILGDIAIRKLSEQGINTGFITRGGRRMGLNFYENGSSVRPSQVIYDREFSAIAEAEPNDFDFKEIFKEAGWFHVSGITPALSDNMAEIVEIALKTAKNQGLTTSVDLNYRRKLWSPEKAKSVMIPLMKHVDVLIGNEEDAEIMLGFKPGNTDVMTGNIDINGYREIFVRMKEQFGFKIIAATLRQSYSASDNGWSVLVYDGKDFCQSKKYNIHLVDRGGGGASFSAGLIYGLYTGMNLEQTTEFSAAVSALKQTIKGDFNLITLKEAETLMEGNVSGRVMR